MHSGGAQQFRQRSQPAQSVFFGHGLGCTFANKSTLLPPSAPRVGGIRRGFQRSNLCLIVLTRALCASLVPRGAQSASALATFFANGCDS